MYVAMLQRFKVKRYFEASSLQSSSVESCSWIWLETVVEKPEEKLEEKRVKKLTGTVVRGSWVWTV